MIKYIKLKNYKSLIDLEVDFMKTANKPKKMVIIYGENGIGKSNFASVFRTLNETLMTKSLAEILRNTVERLKEKNPDQNYNELITGLPDGVLKDTEDIIKENKTVSSKENMMIEICFNIKNNDAIYKLEYSNTELVHESLDYVLNKKQVNYFDITSNSSYLNKNLFKDKTYYKEFLSLMEKYWSKHTLLSILVSELVDKKEEYLKQKINASFGDIPAYITNIVAKVNGGTIRRADFSKSHHSLLDNIEKGQVPLDERVNLDKTEKVLNHFITSVYSDVKQAYYKKEKNGEKITYSLFLKKQIHDELKEVDFSLESTGTKNLLNVIPSLIDACNGDIVIIDEIDTGIHDILMTKLIESIPEMLKGQLIITTHNTTLFESSIPASSFYVFNVNHKSEKVLVPITDFEGRVHPNLNPRKRYLAGLYGGIPTLIDIDFEEVLDNLEN